MQGIFLHPVEAEACLPIESVGTAVFGQDVKIDSFQLKLVKCVVTYYLIIIYFR